jgi:hypothetical protein
MPVSWVALTITGQELVKPNLDGFKYPPLPRSARLGVAVQLLVNSDGIQLVSGHPMLPPAARSNLEKWAIPYASDTPLSVTYIFRLTEEGTTKIVEIDQPIGMDLIVFPCACCVAPSPDESKHETVFPKIRRPCISPK